MRGVCQRCIKRLNKLTISTMSLSKVNTGEAICIDAFIFGCISLFWYIFAFIIKYEIEENMKRQQKTHPKIVDMNSTFASMMDQPRKRYGQQSDCPICMDGIKYELETNCGHVFCCQCWINYVARFSYLNAILCPYCRKNVNILYQCFSEAELNPSSNSESAGDIDKILQEIESYNHRCSDCTPTASSDFHLHYYSILCIKIWLVIINMCWVFLLLSLMYSLGLWLFTPGSQ